MGVAFYCKMFSFPTVLENIGILSVRVSSNFSIVLENIQPNMYAGLYQYLQYIVPILVFCFSALHRGKNSVIFFCCYKLLNIWNVLLNCFFFLSRTFSWHCSFTIRDSISCTVSALDPRQRYTTSLIQPLHLHQTSFLHALCPNEPNSVALKQSCISHI